MMNKIAKMIAKIDVIYEKEGWNDETAPMMSSTLRAAKFNLNKIISGDDSLERKRKLATNLSRIYNQFEYMLKFSDETYESMPELKKIYDSFGSLLSRFIKSIGVEGGYLSLLRPINNDYEMSLVVKIGGYIPQ